MSTLREKMPQDLQLCGLSERTQETCLRAVRQLADFYHALPDQLGEQPLRNYFQGRVERPSVIRQRVHRDGR